MCHKYFCFFLLFCAVFLSFDADSSSLKHNHYNVDGDYKQEKRGRERVVQPKYYVSAGVSFPAHIDISKRYKSNPDKGIALSKPKKNPFYSAAVGMRSSFNDQIALEVEGILYKGRSKVSGYDNSFVHFSADIESFSLLLNSYYLFDGYGGFSPFVGVGVGASYNSITNSTLSPKAGQALELKDDSKVAPAFQVILGVNKKLSQKVDVQMKVKAMSLGKFSGAGSEGRFKAVTISGDVGFRYSLDNFKRIKNKSARGM